MSILSEQQLTRYRAPLLAIACLQAFFTSGIFYGWASLYTLFLESGVYHDPLCARSGESVCAAQKARLTFIYTVASSVNLVSQLPWGLVLDFLGPRVCNMWSTALTIVGFVLLSLSARGVCDAYMLAMCLIAGAGPGAQISLFHLSELFPVRQKSTVLSIVTGAFQLGFVVFLLWHLAYVHLGLELATLSMVYCIPLTLLLLLGGVLWPDAPCIPPDDLDPISYTSREPVPVAPQRDAQGVLVYSKLGHVQARSEEESRRWAAEQEEEQQEREEGRAAAAAAAEGRMSRGSSRITLATEQARLEKQPLLRNLRPAGAAKEESPEGQPEEDDSEAAGARGSRSPTPPISPPDYNYGSLPDPYSSPSLHHVHRSLHALRASQSNPNLKGLTHTNPFSAQLCSPSFLACLLWMSICIFWANYFIGSVVEQLYVKSHFSVSLTREYTSLFTLCLPVGLVGIGVFGWVTDHLGFSASSFLTCSFGVGFASCALWAGIHGQIATHFGLLSGIILAVGGALGAAQVALNDAMLVRDGEENEGYANGRGDEDDLSGAGVSSFRRVNLLQFYMMLATFFFPIYVYVKQRMRASRVEEQIQQHARQLASVY